MEYFLSSPYFYWPSKLHQFHFMMAKENMIDFAQQAVVYHNQWGTYGMFVARGPLLDLGYFPIFLISHVTVSCLYWLQSSSHIRFAVYAKRLGVTKAKTKNRWNSQDCDRWIEMKHTKAASVEYSLTVPSFRLRWVCFLNYCYVVCRFPRFKEL